MVHNQQFCVYNIRKQYIACIKVKDCFTKVLLLLNLYCVYSKYYTGFL